VRELAGGDAGATRLTAGRQRRIVHEGGRFLIWQALTVLGLALLVSGCAAVGPASSLLRILQGGSPAPQVYQQTRIDLTHDNFVLVRTHVVGVSKGFSLRGIITMKPATLAKAMDRMYSAAKMQPGEPQTMGQLVVQNSSSYWILFGIPKVEVHADVFQLNPATPANLGVNVQKREADGEGDGG
jgi:hypothetical protein